jgi:uncharacterized membrane protein
VNSRRPIHLPGHLGERAADLVVGGMGSWRFVIFQSCVVLTWIAANVWVLDHTPFDPYPFILLNLAFSTQAAYASPLILMASNRQSVKDRKRDDLEAEEVAMLYQINQRQLEILEALHEDRRA